MIPPTATEHWKRLSVTLEFERHPFICQSCDYRGLAGWKGKVDLPEPEQCNLRRWREHDQQDKPQNIIVVLCKECSDKLIEPHERLYECIGLWAPAPGAMRICVHCKFREGLHCSNPLLKENGGEGMILKMPTPARGFVDGTDGKGRRTGGPKIFYSGPVTSCEGRTIAASFAADKPKDTECRSCGKPIIWLLTAKGKWMPVDAETVEGEQDLYNADKGHMTHFATCPQSKRWSQKCRVKNK